MSNRLLTLVRHAHADWPPGEPIGADDLRPITPYGQETLSQLLPRLVDEGLLPDVVLHSPLVRSEQTAQQVAEGLGIAERVVREPKLRPGFDEKALADLLIAYGQARWVMLVAHNPDLTNVQYALTRKHVIFSPATVATVELTRERPSLRGVLRWVLRAE